MTAETIEVARGSFEWALAMMKECRESELNGIRYRWNAANGRIERFWTYDGAQGDRWGGGFTYGELVAATDWELYEPAPVPETFEDVVRAFCPPVNEFYATHDASIYRDESGTPFLSISKRHRFRVTGNTVERID